MEVPFRNRREAGQVLAQDLLKYAGRDDVVVLGLPRGGVPVAFEVARELGAPLDALVVRKLGVPGQEELGFGAIAGTDTRVLNPNLVSALGISQPMIERITGREKMELERREHLYRTGKPVADVRGKTVIIVDDGLATGATMHAAVRAIKKAGPKEIVVAAPVCARSTAAEFDREADTVCICSITPEPFYGVGMWYEDFSQTSDDKVIELLKAAGNGSTAKVRKAA